MLDVVEVEVELVGVALGAAEIPAVVRQHGFHRQVKPAVEGQRVVVEHHVVKASPFEPSIILAKALRLRSCLVRRELVGGYALENRLHPFEAFGQSQFRGDANAQFIGCSRDIIRQLKEIPR